MALQGKLETEMELKSSAEKFYNTWKIEPHQIANHAPDHVQTVDLHEGDDWHTGIKIWNYTLDGKAEMVKEKLDWDDESKTIHVTALEGHVCELYKVFKATFYLEPKPDGEGTIAKLVIEYEKVNEEVPAPDKYMDLMIKLTIDIDASLVSQINEELGAALTNA